MTQHNMQKRRGWCGLSNILTTWLCHDHVVAHIEVINIKASTFYVITYHMQYIMPRDTSSRERSYHVNTWTKIYHVRGYSNVNACLQKRTDKTNTSPHGYIINK